MSDIVERLRMGVRRLDRKPADNNSAERELAKEAADEIERLRGALAEIAETPGRRWQRKIAKAALDTKEPKA